MNSRNKGKRGELELAHLLKTYGYPAERGVQYSGLKGNADVVGVEGLHIECKRSERVTEEDFIKQAEINNILNAREEYDYCVSKAQSLCKRAESLKKTWGFE